MLQARRQEHFPNLPVRLMLVVASAVLPMLSACKMTGTSAKTEPQWECLAFQPVRWSSRDTVQTISQVKQHNAVWKELCQD